MSARVTLLTFPPLSVAAVDTSDEFSMSELREGR